MPAQETTTVTDDLESNTGTGGHLLALRWVYPEPERPAVWLQRDVVIGRDEGCEVRIEGPQVSRRHARLERVGGVWLIRDLDSKMACASTPRG